jgi:KEOPS complex subunit Cgi121
MRAGDRTCNIRAALCSIDDKPGFLLVLKEVARRFNTHIICFNADMLAGRRHAESAVLHAVSSFESGDAISNTLEMEALLYAAGSRQCNVAALFGIHEGVNHLWVCCYPSADSVWDALTPVLQFYDANAWDGIDHKKREHLMQLYEITPEELESLDRGDRFADLVLERVALLNVMR